MGAAFYTPARRARSGRFLQNMQDLVAQLPQNSLVQELARSARAAIESVQPGYRPGELSCKNVCSLVYQRRPGANQGGRPSTGKRWGRGGTMDPNQKSNARAVGVPPQRRDIPLLEKLGIISGIEAEARGRGVPVEELRQGWRGLAARYPPPAKKLQTL